MTKASGETVASVSDAAAVADEPGGEPVPLPEVASDRYAFGGEIGRGGIGRVVEARDSVLGRTIAIKELHDRDPATRRRFVREALITARLQHPAIVPIYEAGRRGDAPFYAMKHVRGETLGDALARCKTLADRLALVPNVLAVADAIAYAHGARIVHRDLKPQNVLLGDFGETVVIDWGLAKDLGGDDRDAADAGPFRVASAHETVAGAVMGTPAYMAPEQAEGKEVDERADVYALGALLYHVIAGGAPHAGKQLETMIDRIIHGEVTPLAEREPHAPADLVAIVEKAMAVEPTARYPTARELAEDLRRFQTGQLVGAHEYTLGERLRRFVRKHRAIVVIATVAIAILLVYGGWSVRRIVGESELTASNNNRAVLAKAEAALDHDPAETLAWLHQLDPRGDGWERARTFATEAAARPLPDRILRGGPRDAQLVMTERSLILTANAGATIIDLATHRIRTRDGRVRRARRADLTDRPSRRNPARRTMLELT